MPRIKIVEKGWAGFTGNFGTAVFKDGIAEVSALEAGRIGAAVAIETLDDQDEGTAFSVTNEMVRTKHLAAEVVPALTRMLPAEATDEEIEEALESFAMDIDDLVPEEITEEDEDENAEPEVEKTIYTREQLEAIADQEGIGGLREIGTPLNVKSTSIIGLIDLILEKQGE